MNFFNRKDKLFQEALDGEISLHELSPTDRAEAESFIQLRQDLRALREIPELQLSNERMRDAILSASLNKKSSSASPGFWNAVWIPTAACAFVVAFVGMNQYFKGQREPVIRTGESLSGNVAALGPSTNFRPILPERHVLIPPVATTANTAAVPSGVTARDHRLAQRSTARTVTMTQPSGSGEGELLLDPNKFVAFVNRGDSEVMLPAPESSDSGPIVVIDSAPGAGTMNPVATETGSTSNVIVGG